MWTLLLPFQNRMWAEKGATEETSQLVGAFSFHGLRKRV